MNPYTYLISLLSSASARFFCTDAEITTALLSVAYFSDTSATSFFRIPTYREKTEEEFKMLVASLSDKEIHLTTDYASEEITPGSLAYHPVSGFITADSRWWFSSKQFVNDLVAAESNPFINAHFLHINSGGGEAWYLDEVAKTLSGLNKPVYTFIEKLAASAGYYIGVHGNTIKTFTQNDIVGSIGTMVDGMDWVAYLEKVGIKRIRETATRSDLKNKKFEDLRNGKPEQFIREDLDPLQQQFETAVRAARPALNNLPDDDPVFRGETFLSAPAIDKKLIDGITSLPAALSEADAMGKEWASQQKNKKRILSYL